MAVAKPSSKPKLNRRELYTMLANQGHILDHQKYPLYVIGIRGYYLNSMGRPAKNDRGIYDDAIFIASKDQFLAFNGNTDPSVYNPGIAVLKPGMYIYRKGKHGISGSNPYPALRQHGKVTVIRDGGKEESGIFWINIHKGSINSTSSAGCQTIYPQQWKAFIDTVYDTLTKENQRDVPYILIEQE